MNNIDSMVNDIMNIINEGLYDGEREDPETRKVVKNIIIEGKIEIMKEMWRILGTELATKLGNEIDNLEQLKGK